MNKFKMQLVRNYSMLFLFFSNFQVLLTALRFNNKAVAQIASDMVLLLSDHVEKLLDFYPEVPKKIVEVLARTLTSLIPQVTHDLENDERRLLLSLLFCLGEWVMRLPKFMLTHPQEDGKPLLYHVFASLYAASGSQFRPQKPEKVNLLCTSVLLKI